MKQINSLKPVLIVLLILAIILCLFSCSRTHVKKNANVTLLFNRKGENISIVLSEEEAERVVDIFNGKHYESRLFGIPSCGFSEDISIKIGDRTFAIACDTCNCIQDQSKGRYFSIPESDIDYIHALFEKYGGYFPCV